MAASPIIELVEAPLVTEDYVSKVKDPGAGAIATFSGSTRNTFQDKKVVRLEYEAYKPMAEKKLKEIADAASSKWALCKVAIAHALGVVNVSEVSVVVAVSSAHRREALEACHWIIDELKATTPIWKKEHFEDGSVWKENAESRRLLAEAKANTS